MTTRYQSSYDYTTPFTELAPSVALAQDTELTYTVPGTSKEKYVVHFHYASSSNVFVANNSTASSPSAGTIDASSRSAYKPHKKFVHGGDVLSFITPDTDAIFGFELWSLMA